MDKSTETMIANLENSTGKKLEEWVGIVKKTGLKKHGEMITYLKTEHAFTHGYANLVALKAREQESGFAAPDETLLKDQYSGKEALKPLYDKIIGEVTRFGTDVEIAPKKTYVSLRRKKQFAIIQPSTKTRIDIGINIKDKGFSSRLEKSGSFNSMCSHRVRIESPHQVDAELLQWMKQAYDQS